MIAVDDSLLSIPFMKFCLKACVQNIGNLSKNVLASPNSASDEVLSKFPPTRMLICEIDAIRDNQFDFAFRLKRLGVDIKITYLKGYIHGFCLFD
jgi:acetyl esterase/lipase